ncbi:hypothetical protein [Celeribacter sp.]|uniref:hypothetical protein n=1 Tax=Celeribacter sp. TaxID=1890673 RepID=UPI003A8F6FEB
MTGERYHLKGWLSNRLGSEVRIPDLTVKGLTMLHWQGGTWHSTLVGPYGMDRMTEIAQSVQGAMY